MHECVSTHPLCFISGTCRSFGESPALAGGAGQLNDPSYGLCRPRPSVINDRRPGGQGRRPMPWSPKSGPASIGRWIYATESTDEQVCPPGRLPSLYSQDANPIGASGAAGAGRSTQDICSPRMCPSSVATGANRPGEAPAGAVVGLPNHACNGVCVCVAPPAPVAPPSSCAIAVADWGSKLRRDARTT